MKNIIKNRVSFIAAIAVVGRIAGTRVACAQSKLVSSEQAKSILIYDVRIFDVVSDELNPGNLLIVGSKIKKNSSAWITAPEAHQYSAAAERLDSL